MSDPTTQRERGLKFNLQPDGSGAVTLYCRGRIVFGAEVRALSTLVMEVLPATGRMSVDLAEVEWIDSAGLGELVLLHLWAQAAGYHLQFADPKPRVRRLFELTNLALVLEIHESVTETTRTLHNEQLCSA